MKTIIYSAKTENGSTYTLKTIITQSGFFNRKTKFRNYLAIESLSVKDHILLTKDNHNSIIHNILKQGLINDLEYGSATVKHIVELMKLPKIIQNNNSVSYKGVTKNGTEYKVSILTETIGWLFPTLKISNLFCLLNIKEADYDILKKINYENDIMLYVSRNLVSTSLTNDKKHFKIIKQMSKVLNIPLLDE